MTITGILLWNSTRSQNSGTFRSQGENGSVYRPREKDNTGLRANYWFDSDKIPITQPYLGSEKNGRKYGRFKRT